MQRLPQFICVCNQLAKENTSSLPTMSAEDLENDTKELFAEWMEGDPELRKLLFAEWKAEQEAGDPALDVE